MRIRLVFSAWLDKDGKPVAYFSAEGFELLGADFRVNATFEARIELDEDASAILRTALAEGYSPVFYAVAVDPDGWRESAEEAKST